MKMAVVTPTYAPDRELFADLHESVLNCFPDDVSHIAIVDEADLPQFRRFSGPRCDVIGVRDVLPRTVRALPVGKLWVNLRRPVPPLRGWIIQQLTKLAICEQIEERLVVLADSDLVFVRPVTAELVAPGGRVRIYRKENGVDDGLPRHVRWHEVARQALGMPPARPPFHDYVSSLNVWDRDVVLRALRRVEAVTGRRWLDALGRELHFSEWTLYGVYVDEFEDARDVTATAESLCHSYWDTAPLSEEAATAFMSSVGPADVAYMIGAKSRTPLSVRRAAHARLLEGVAQGQVGL
jgi:hypothetical protein